MQAKEFFEQKTPKGYTNYIVFQEMTDSTIGVFYGREVNEDNVPVFFRSRFSYPTPKNLNRDKIYFKLTIFDCSFTPFNFASDNNDLIKDSLKIPFILYLPILFFGERKQDTLDLNIVGGVNDNPDSAIFFKVNRPKTM